eukprot:9535104-Lingulodinium_polyedra.AAC.1
MQSGSKSPQAPMAKGGASSSARPPPPHNIKATPSGHAHESTKAQVKPARQWDCTVRGTS